MKHFPSRKRKYILLTMVFLLAVALAVTILLPYVVDINNYKEFLITKAEEQLHRRVQIEKIQLHFINGIGIRCMGVIIGNLDGQGEFISAKNVFLKFKPIPLLDKELVIKKIILDHPRINIKRDAKGKLNLLAPKTAEEEAEKAEEIKWSLSSFTVGKIAIRKGQATFMDKAINKRGVLTEIKDLNLTVKKFELGRPFDLTLNAKLGRGKKKSSQVKLSARITGLTGDLIDPAKINLKAKIKITNFDMRTFVPYYKKYLPYEDLSGLADITLDYEGNLVDDFKLKAKVKAKSVRLIYQKKFTAPLTCRTASAQVSLTLKNDRLDMGITHIKVDTGHFDTSGKLYLNDLLSDKKSIQLEASCSPFTLEDAKPYIPFKTIPPKPADLINNSFCGGMFEDLSVTLDGEIRRFGELDKPENFGVLSASVKFTDIGLELADDYKFEQINGSVDLREGMLVFNELNANIGNSQLKIYDSQITNLYAKPQFDIQSTAYLSLNDNLIRQTLPATIDKMNPRGQASMYLQAKGDSQKLALNGVLNLNQVSYSYGSRLRKEAGHKNTLSFEGQLLDWQTHKLHRLTYSLGKSQVLINVEGIKPVRLDLQTDSFDMQDLRLIMPNLFTQGTKGLITADVRILGGAEDSSGMSVSGNMNLRQGRIQLAKYSPKMEGDGQLQFNILDKPDGLQISGKMDLTQVAYAYKDRLNKPRGQKNAISFRGILKDDKSLQLEELLFALESSEAKFTGTINDFTSMDSELKVTGEGIEIDHITSFATNILPDKVTISGGNLDVDIEISGPLTDSSRLAFKGDAKIYSTHLRRDDPHYQLDNLSAQLNYPGDSALTISLQAEQGNSEKFNFSNLIGKARLKKSKLLIQELSLDTYRGNLLLKGKLNYPPTPLRYDISFTAEKMDVKQLAQELNLIKDGVITGKLAAVGKLSNTGDGKNKFAGLNGILGLELTNGNIKRYGILAKIFSMISPGTIIDSSVPDFGTEGFPYKSIKGTFKIVNGVVSIENLVLSSDAWKIVTLGDIDLVNDKLALKVYVQPFQKFDNLISLIPGAGKILTGGKGGLLDTFFIVEGSFDSPEVTAKPLTSLAEKILGIFTRTLSLPFTIFSD